MINSQALEIAAQCWCDEETSHIQMEPALAQAFAARLIAWSGTPLPIESAPDDGSPVDIWLMDETRLPNCFYYRNEQDIVNNGWRMQSGQVLFKVFGMNKPLYWSVPPAAPSSYVQEEVPEPDTK